MKFSLDQFTFEERGESVRVYFLRAFYFDVDKDEFSSRMSCTISGKEVDTALDSDSAFDAFQEIFSENISELRHKITGNKTVYIHRNSGVPLIG